MPTRLVVIGAGVAGLSTAIHAARAGFEVEVFEAHSLPGGLCTSWRRDGYEFDGCVEWFVGSSPDSPLHESWRAVGVTPRDFVHRSVFTDHRLPDGRHVRLPGDPDRLVAEFTRVSPADAAVAGELADLVRRWPTAARCA